MDISVKVIPKSSKNEIAGHMADGTLRVKVAAVPEKGKANAALRKFLAEHYGVPVGTPVLAVGDGRVKEAGSSRASGNYIKLAHRDGYESLYLHLSRLNVKSGDIVHMNDVVGLSGNTGRSTGPHLHYELHLAGIPLDPLATMPASTIALGPRALRDHVAFFKQLEAIDDRRAAE